MSLIFDKRDFTWMLVSLTMVSIYAPALAWTPFGGTAKNASAAANTVADNSMSKEIVYANAATPGPQVIVLPGEIKSTNTGFTEKFTNNNIADFAELELSKDNFEVLERADLGPVLQEFQTAYALGDADAARKLLKKGKLKSTKWILRFDILKAEPVAEQKKGFNGGVARGVLSALGGFGLGGSSGTLGAGASQVAATVAGSVDTSQSASIWIVGMRYKIIDANTTDQVATGYTEEKMEIGADSTSVAGISSANARGVSLDSMVQRLVREQVSDIDAKHK
jgi:hypothetical protein